MPVLMRCCDAETLLLRWASLRTVLKAGIAASVAAVGAPLPLLLFFGLTKPRAPRAIAQS
jgi:hypothetical protein